MVVVCDVRILIVRWLEHLALAVALRHKALVKGFALGHDRILHPLHECGILAFKASCEYLCVLALNGGHRFFVDGFTAAKLQIILQKTVFFHKKLSR